MSKYNVYVEDVSIEAVFNKLGGIEGARRFLRGELWVSEVTRWHEEEGVVYFSVKSDGTTGEDWLKRLKKKGIHVDSYAERFLLSPDFKPTSGVITDVVVLRGALFESQGRTKYADLLAYAETFRTVDKRRLIKTNPELACLALDKFTAEEFKAMNLQQLTPAHEPINGQLLGVYSKGVNSLDTSRGGLELMWDPHHGLAFAACSSENSVI